ncbi:MAG TPA: HAMP domain-containing sensor histidine kinase, partial [Verrucomicrobiota bacterium]|nr:HAMP domain-containing sensor histidine kinase [Verrucomicrobiota bacterium]
FLGGLAMVTDITSRKHAEDALHAREIQLRQLNATKDKFFSIIAHDLKNPLNTLGMGLALLRDRPPEEREALVTELQEDAQRLRQLLENLLTWARLEQRQLIPICFAFDLRHMIDETLALLTPLAAHKQIALSAAPFPGHLSITADEKMLQTVIRNLVTNALKFTKQGGSVTVSAHEYGDTTEIVVADTGIGIPSDELDQLFRIDAQKRRKGTRGEEGTGLGLILCQEFVKQHGGTIRLESEDRNGTRAIVRLPRIADSAPASECSALQTSLSPTPARTGIAHSRSAHNTTSPGR